MQVIDIKETIDAWSSLANKVTVAHTEEEYKQLVAVLDNLIDEVGESEDHPLSSLMEVIGVLVENYENQYVSELSVEN
ncbi:MAG: hypothetical protein AAFR63_05790 [Cyanobacteria bacterium J06631_6]